MRVTYKQQMRVGLVGGVAVALFAACALGSLAFAGYLALARVVAPVYAALIVAVIALVAASIALLVTRRLIERHRPRTAEAERTEALNELEETLRTNADPLLDSWARRHPTGAAAASLAVGVAAGYSRTLRTLLQDVYEQYAETSEEREDRRQR